MIQYREREMKPTGSKIILLVEDDTALNRAVTLKLNKQGYRVISTFNAREALEALRSEYATIDIIWLDLLLPEMNGIDLLAKIRKNDDYKDLKVVICSVSGNEESRNRAREFKVVDYLIKSDYGIDALIEKVLSYT